MTIITHAPINEDSGKIIYNKNRNTHTFKTNSYTKEVFFTVYPQIIYGDEYDEFSQYDNFVRLFESFIEGEKPNKEKTVHEVVETEDDTETNTDDGLGELFNPNKETIEKTIERDVIETIDSVTIEYSNNEIIFEVTMSDGNQLECSVYYTNLISHRPNTTGTIFCEKCGQTISITHTHEYSDFAYCDNCDIKYTRDRELVSTTSSEEFGRPSPKMFCSECEELHSVTLPDGSFTKSEHNFWGQEGFGYNCKCGNTISGREFEPNTTIECECGRKLTLSIE